MMQQAAFAQQQAPLTSSGLAKPIPSIGEVGHVDDVLKIEHKGPVKVLWEKIKAFVASLDNTDV